MMHIGIKPCILFIGLVNILSIHRLSHYVVSFWWILFLLDYVFTINPDCFKENGLK